MTRYYIKLGSEVPFGTSEHRISYDPADLSTVQALWAALPPDLRLALAKTAPRVATVARFEGKESSHRAITVTSPTYPGAIARAWNGHVDKHGWATGRWLWFAFGGENHEAADDASALRAISAALRAQGYVLDGDTP
ncbi:MAG TPA: hypothetical protein VGK73_08935 [Polyangiaceae bacterium]